jgi:serine protease AprX
MVRFASAADATAARRGLGAIGLRKVFNLFHGFSATMTVGQARALAKMPGVLRVEEVAPVVAFMETARHDFGIDKVQQAPPTGLGYTGAGVGICIVDTGIFAGHEEFVAPDGTSKVADFWDFVGTSLTPYDDNGHGTHVASIAAGDGTGIDSFAPTYRGVAPGARLYVAKVLDANGSGSDDNVIAAIDWCVGQQGVDIINLSLGIAGSSDGTDLVSQAVNAAVNNGKVAVVGAGNDGAAPQTIGSPAAAAQAITVGAAAEWSAPSLLDGESDGIYVAPFSSRGPTADGRVKPDIVAPGHTIVAGYIDPSGTGLYGCTNDCYTALSGTSMATPFVSGTVALMLQANPALTPANVRAILDATAQDRGALAADGSAVQDNDWGYGLLDGYAAVAQASAAVGNAPTAFPDHFYGTGSVSGTAPTVIPIVVPPDGATAPLAVAVTILSGAPQLFCDPFLGCLNEWRPDYDVRLRDPNGVEVAKGNCMLGASFGLQCDNVGRQETMHVASPVPGTYTLEVYKGTTDSNNGQFSYEVSRGPVATGAVPNNLPPFANAGPDQTTTVADGSLATVTLDGSGSRDSDGAITSYVWREGITQIASGATPTVQLAAGTHTIALMVTDDKGASASDSVVVTVKSLPLIHVGDLDRNTGTDAAGWWAQVTVRVHSATHGAIAGALVTGTWSAGATGTAQCTTDVYGGCKVKKSGIPSSAPSVTFTIDDVAKSGRVYSSGANHDPDGGSNGTAIAISSPLLIHVGDLDRNTGTDASGWWTQVTVRVHSATHGAVTGALVSGTWSGGATGTAQCTTNYTGYCNLTKSGIPTSELSVTFTVDDVVKPSRLYSAIANHDPDADSNGTAITVAKPSLTTALR